MEKTLILIKPNAVQRGLIGEIIARIERKGLHITGLKMMQLDDTILNEHYAHLSERSFFKILKDSMMVTPVVAMCVEGLDAVETVRLMVGATNARKALGMPKNVEPMSLIIVGTPAENPTLEEPRYDEKKVHWQKW